MPPCLGAPAKPGAAMSSRPPAASSHRNLRFIPGLPFSWRVFSVDFPVDSLVQPHVLVAVAVVGAIDHHGHAFEVRLPAGPLPGVEDDRPRHVLLQSLSISHTSFLRFSTSVSI